MHNLRRRVSGGLLLHWLLMYMYLVCHPAGAAGRGQSPCRHTAHQPPPALEAAPAPPLVSALKPVTRTTKQPNVPTPLNVSVVRELISFRCLLGILNCSAS